MEEVEREREMKEKKQERRDGVADGNKRLSLLTSFSREAVVRGRGEEWCVHTANVGLEFANEG